LGEQQIRELKAKGVSGPEINHQLYLGAEASRLSALENFPDIIPAC